MTRCDGPVYMPKYGDICAIFVLGEGYDELKALFDKLRAGAQTDRFQDLHDMPFGAYGQFFDTYGYQWIFTGERTE